MFPVLQIGPLALRTPGLILILGLWIGLTLAERQARYYRTRGSDLYNLVFYIMVAGLIGARVVYVVLHLEAFIASPISLISLNPELLDLSGGAASGLLAAVIYDNRKNLLLWPTLDALTPLLAVLMITLGLVHLASGDAFGIPTDLPWGIELWGAKRHPFQVYEILAAGLILWAIWPRKKPSSTSIPGTTFLTFVALSAGTRLFLETFHGDSLLVFGNIRVIQVVSWFILAYCLWGLGLIRATPSENTQNETLEEK
jgi:phosphatidylglycerol:prolipoprotein diacylglycerol transferase